MRYDTGMANRLGNRASNQDRCSIVERDDSVLLLLADGMGGHKKGEVAAQEMVNSITRTFRNQALPITDSAKFLEQAITAAHYHIAESGQQLNPPVHPRTTCVACLIQGGVARWAHVGDSRLYLLRDQEIVVRTQDHTYIEELRQHNLISEKEMSRHPMRNYVTYCLGGPEPAPPVSISEETALKFEDIILLCSDGLWNALDVRGITHLLNGHTLDEAVNIVAEQAERSSYPNSDNISVIAIRLLPDLALDTDFTLKNSTTPVNPPHPQQEKDQLRTAINQIRNAINEYKDEIGNEKKP